MTTDPRLNVDVMREIDYYAKQSTNMTHADHASGRVCGDDHGHWSGFWRAEYDVFGGGGSRAGNCDDAGAGFWRAFGGVFVFD